MAIHLLLLKAKKIPTDAFNSIQETLSLLCDSVLYAGLSHASSLTEAELSLLKKLQIHCHDVSPAIEYYGAIQQHHHETVNIFLLKSEDPPGEFREHDYSRIRTELYIYTEKINDLARSVHSSAGLLKAHRETLAGLQKQFLTYQKHLVRKIEKLRRATTVEIPAALTGYVPETRPASDIALTARSTTWNR